MKAAFQKRALSFLLQRTNRPNMHNSATSASTQVAGQKRKRPTEKKYYAVRIGRKPGIYENWQECLDQVTAFKQAMFKSFTSVEDAQAFVDGRPVSSPEDSKPKPQRFYGIQKGRVPGVYTDWASAQSQINGFLGPKFKKFSTRAEAEAFVAIGKKTALPDIPTGLSEEEEKRWRLTRETAPGMIIGGDHVPKDKQGQPYELGKGPLPAGAEDGYDPNIKPGLDSEILKRTEEEKAKTKTIPGDQDLAGVLRIYTDGASSRNGQVGARAGIGVYFGPRDPKNISEPLKGSKQTNQRAELTAILRALDVAPRNRNVAIYTDSRYSIDCVTKWYKSWEKNGWVNAKGKSVENKDLVQEIRARISERNLLSHKTYFRWVKGHADDAGNIAADKLACQGASMNTHRDIAGEAKNDDDDDDNDEHESDEEVRSSLKLMREAIAEEKATR